MPIHLPQISRRDFLKRAAVSTTALALAPAVCAADPAKPADKDTFVFFSDTHISADPRTVAYDANMTVNLTATVKDFLAWSMNPALVLINGDLAFTNGLPGDYAAFGDLISAVRTVAPVRLALGNHDHRDNFRRAFPKDATADDIGEHRQVAFFSSEHANWFQLDSLQKTNDIPGELGAAQLDWLSHQLSAHTDKPAIIVGHHNLNPPKEKVGLIGLSDTAALEGLFTLHPQVKAYIYGHTHDWHVTRHATGVHLINLPSTAYIFKTGRPIGWVRATIAPDGAEFELRCLDRKHPEHGQVEKLKWRTA